MRGNGGNASRPACRSCDSPPDQSIPPSMNLPWERKGPGAVASNHLGKRALSKETSAFERWPGRRQLTTDHFDSVVMRHARHVMRGLRDAVKCRQFRVIGGDKITDGGAQ